MTNRTPVIIAAVAVAVVGLAGLAVVVTGGDDGDTADGSAPVPTFSSDAVQHQPVEFSGQPLPALDPTLATDPAVGAAAPVIDGADFDGNPVTIGGATGNRTLLVFLAHWCPHCNDEVPEILEWNADGGVPADLDIIGISTAVEPGAPNYPPSDWVVDKGWLWPVLADDENSASFLFYGGSGFPYLVLLDEDGAVVARASGTKSAAELDAWVTG